MMVHKFRAAVSKAGGQYHRTERAAVAYNGSQSSTALVSMINEALKLSGRGRYTFKPLLLLISTGSDHCKAVEEHMHSFGHECYVVNVSEVGFSIGWLS